MPPRHVQIILLAMLVSLACFHRSSHNRYATMVAEAMQTIDQWHVEPVGRRELFDGAMRGMVRSIDPYSGYIDAGQYARWQEEISQEFGGTGIVVVPDPKTARPLVTRPIFNSPAFTAGVRPGALIMRIDGRDTAEMEPEEWTRNIKGKPGTAVRLQWLPAGEKEPKEALITRAVIPIESVLGDSRDADGRWVFLLQDHPKIGYVRITSFGDKTVTEFRQAITSVSSEIDRLILDLRSNDGGLLTAAYEVCDFFLKKGTVVEIRGRDRILNERFMAQDNNELIDSNVPIVVLIDRYSASAAEIVAAALQDHRRATIVGERSWGKGTVQHIFELEGGRSALRLTTATYWRPSGKNIHRTPDSKPEEEWGVTPDPQGLVELDQATFVRRLEWRAQRDGGLLLSTNGETRTDLMDFQDAQLEKGIVILKGE